jgi:4-hydroxy-tetrahydrodipicolinate synthase
MEPAHPIPPSGLPRKPASSGGVPGAQCSSKLGGIVTALVTPLTSGHELDVTGMEHLIAGQLIGGVNALFVLGSVGEGPLLSDRVSDEVAKCAVRCIGRRVPLLAGASDNSVERCLARLDRLATIGVGYGVVTLPFYGWPGRVSDSVRFFVELAARSPMPIVAYNLPKAVGWQMPVEALEELYQIPNLVCLKDTHGDFEKMAALASSPRRPPHFSYLPGNSQFAARLIRLGADGVVSTPANLFPDLFAVLWRLCREQQWDRVEQLDRDLVPRIVKLLDLMPTGAASIKGLLKLRGTCQKYTVPPWPEAGEEDLKVMREALAKVDSEIAAYALAQTGGHV